MNRDPNNNLPALLLHHVRTHPLINDGDRWLLAVSGGADSTAMMHALVHLRPQLPELHALHIAHLNHLIRGPQAHADAAFVQEQARRLNLPVTVDSADVPALARQTGASIETTARNARYDFLARTARQQNCSKIALAHTADDNVETILHRIMRGTGIRGLAGIPSLRPLADFLAPPPEDQPPQPIMLIRPLLTVSRTQVESFLTQQGIDYRTDQTNLCNDYTRNRIRNQLLPLLRQDYNPALNAALSRLGCIAAELTADLERRARQTFQTLLLNQQDNSLSLDARPLAQIPAAQQAEVIRSALLNLPTPLRRIGFEQINSILSLLNDVSPTPAPLQRPAGLTVRLEHGTLIFTLTEPAAALAPPSPLPTVPLNAPGLTNLPPGYRLFNPETRTTDPLKSLTARILPVDPAVPQPFHPPNDPHRELLDLDQIVGPLQLRAR